MGPSSWKATLSREASDLKNIELLGCSLLGTPPVWGGKFAYNYGLVYSGGLVIDSLCGQDTLALYFGLGNRTTDRSRFDDLDMWRCMNTRIDVGCDSIHC